MARKYLFGPDRRYVGFGLERCEERVLIAYHQEIVATIRPDAVWKQSFQIHFYELGDGLSELHLNFINSERKRHRLAEFSTLETQMADYGKSMDRTWKANERCRMRDEYLDLSLVDRIQWIEDAKNLVDRLPSPHYTHDEYEIKRSSQVLNYSEIARRRNAMVTPAAIPKTRSIEVEQAIRLLSVATKEETINRIVAQILPENALTVVEGGKFSDETIDKLINRSLEAFAMTS